LLAADTRIPRTEVSPGGVTCGVAGTTTVVATMTTEAAATTTITTTTDLG
jgi:hypothetical protein